MAPHSESKPDTQPADPQPTPSEASQPPGSKSDEAADFAREAELPAPGLIAEFWDFLRYNKKWWLAPIIVLLFLIGLFAVLGNSALAPFIYPLF